MKKTLNKPHQEWLNVKPEDSGCDTDKGGMR